MATSLYFMEAANLYVGDADPNGSLHLVLESIKLPDLQETTQEWTGGGAIGAVDISMGVLQKLEVGFKLKGEQPEVMTKFGLGSTRRQNFTARGAIRDKTTGEAIESLAVIEGRLTKVAGDEYKRGELKGYDYGITEIFRYELSIGGAEKFYYDFLTSEWRVNGEKQNQDVLRALGIG